MCVYLEVQIDVGITASSRELLDCGAINIELIVLPKS